MITGKEILGMVINNGGQGWQGMWSGMGASGWSSGFFPFMLAISLFAGLVVLGLWIYTSFAYMEIAKRLKYKNPWLAWIPFARGAMVLQLGGLPWGWVFLWSPLVLFPLMYLGAWKVLFVFLASAGMIAFSVLCYIAHWRFFEKRGYYGWLALVPLVGVVPYIGWSLSPFAGIAFLIILGFVAWKDGDMVKRSTLRMPRAPQRRSSSRSSGSRRKRR